MSDEITFLVDVPNPPKGDGKPRLATDDDFRKAGYVKLDGIDVELEGHQLIGSLAPYWKLTDWEAEGKPELQGTPKEIIAEAWDTINYLAEQYDRMRSQVIAALGEVTDV